jgi:hypothetical protein
MNLVTIDPGMSTGVAEFQNEVLLNVGLIKFECCRQYTKDLFRLMDVAKPERVVIEIPKIYPFKNQKGDQNDLIKLAVQAGICIAAASPFCHVEEVHPQEWKGQRPKEVDNKHTLSLLYDPVELDVFNSLQISKNLRHNVLDAIGIGLWVLKRR